MSQVGIVIVSHSHKLATAAVDLVAQMVSEETRPPVRVAAGLDETTLGTDAAAVSAAIEELSECPGILVLVACGLVVYYLQRGRWGSSWKAVAFSERGTASLGQSVPGAKLTAFAVSATLGGISGGLIAGQVGLAFASSFSPIQSLALYVLAIMSGAHLIDMAIFGGIVWIVVPELLKRWGIPQDWGFVVFGVLGVQALTSGSNLGTGIRSLWWRRRRATTTNSLTSEAAATPVPERTFSGEPILVVKDLSVTFGKVEALKKVSFELAEGTVLGLIGPNGAGKSTLVDALTGFLPQHTGSVFRSH